MNLSREPWLPSPFRRRLLVGLACALLAGVAGVTASGAQPPNILLVLADDLGIEHLAAYGIGTTDFATTPNLDRIADKGLVFRQAWSAPSCSPTRVAMQTGRYPFRTGVGAIVPKGGEFGLQLEEITIGELLQQAPTPYATGYFGKWHMGESDETGGVLTPNLAGYDHFDGWLKREQEPGGVPYFDWVRTINGVSERSTVYATTAQVDGTIDWIQTVEPPWFALLAFQAPHDPFHWPPDDLHTEDTSQEGDVPKYHAMIEAVDTELGRLLDTIDTSNTIIVFASDNGPLGDVALPPVVPTKAKGTTFQGGVRVPLILRSGIVPTGEVEGLVHLLDLYATLAEIAGAELPTDRTVDAVSLVPYLEDPARPSLRSEVYTERFRPNGLDVPRTFYRAAARDLQYKLLLDSDSGKAFFDLAADPWEGSNLLDGALTPEQQAAMEALQLYVQELHASP